MAFEAIVRGGGQQTQPFGCSAYACACQCEWRCPGRCTCPGYALHAGIDVARTDPAILTAAGYGIVQRIGRPGGSCGGLGPYAVCVWSGPIDVWYGHASQNLVSIGQRVVPGQALAVMGSLGCSTGQHVHYEVQPHGSVDGCLALDPGPYLWSWPGVAPGAPPPDPGSPPGPQPMPAAGRDLAALLVIGGGALLGLSALNRRGRA